jgi:uncharacterized protein YeeX (DUF496 family)
MLLDNLAGFVRSMSGRSNVLAPVDQIRNVVLKRFEDRVVDEMTKTPHVVGHDVHLSKALQDVGSRIRDHCDRVFVSSAWNVPDLLRQDFGDPFRVAVASKFPDLKAKLKERNNLVPLLI